MNSASRYHLTDTIISQRDIPGLPYNDMLHIKNINDEMASFVCLEKQPQSALMQTMCSSIFAGKQQGLTVHYELDLSALFLFLIMTLTGDVASGMK